MAETRSNIRRRQPDARLLAGFDRSRRQLSTNTKIINLNKIASPKSKFLYIAENFAGSRLVTFMQIRWQILRCMQKPLRTQLWSQCDVLRVSTIFFKIWWREPILDFGVEIILEFWALSRLFAIFGPSLAKYNFKFCKFGDK